MGSVLKQFLLLGGFYFIISLFLGLSKIETADRIDDIVFLGIIIMIIILCFKKSFSFLTTFQQKFPKTDLYLRCLGAIEYIGILLFSVLGAIDGYNGAMARYHQTQYESTYSIYKEEILVIYGLLALLIFLWATYINFIKPHLNRNNL